MTGGVKPPLLSLRGLKMDGYIYVKEDYFDLLKEENEELKNEVGELKKEREKLYKYLKNMSRGYGDLLNTLEFKISEHRKILDEACEYENL